MNSLILKNPTRTGLTADSLNVVKADPAICKRLEEILGCKGKVVGFESPFPAPYGYFKFDPENQSLPLFIKVLSPSVLERQILANEIAKNLESKDVLASCLLPGFPKVDQSDQAILVYKWINGRFTNYENSDLEILGKEIAKLHDALRGISLEPEIQKATEERRKLLQNSADTILAGRYAYGPFPQWVKQQMENWAKTSGVLKGDCQVIHGDLNIGNVMFLEETGRPVFLDFEGSTHSWLPRKIDAAKAIERFSLVHHRNNADALKSSQSFLQGYLSGAEQNPFDNPEDLQKTLLWLALRSFCILNELQYQGQPIPAEEWKKHKMLFEHAQARHDLLKEVVQPFFELSHGLSKIHIQPKSENDKNPKKTILFVTYGGGHVNMLIPVILALKQQGEFDIHVLGLTTAGSALEAAGIPYMGFRHLLKPEDKKAAEWGRKLAPTVANPLVPYEESIAYMGLCYRDLEKRIGEKEAARLFGKYGRQTFFPELVMKRLFNDLEPDLVVATNSPRAERAAITTAGKLDIPAICLVDLFATCEVQWIGERDYADKICVLSELVKKHIVRSGRKKEEVVVTGNPTFDRLAKENISEAAESLRRRYGWENKSVILWASQAFPKQHLVTGKCGDPTLPRQIEEKLFEILKKHPDWQLIIRLHSTETVNFESLPPRVELCPKNIDLATLLKAVDVVVSVSSTVGLEGALLGTPFITMDMSIFSENAPFSAMGFSLGVSHFDELENTLIEAMEKKWEPPANLPALGQATHRVIKVIRETLKINAE